MRLRLHSNLPREPPLTAVLLATDELFGLSFIIGNLLLSFVIGIDALKEIITDDPRNHVKGLTAMILFSLLFCPYEILLGAGALIQGLKLPVQEFGFHFEVFNVCQRIDDFIAAQQNFIGVGESFRNVPLASYAQGFMVNARPFKLAVSLGIRQFEF